MSYEDPFNSAPAETAVAEGNPDKVTVTPAPDGGVEVSLTFKGGRDFDAPWIVVRTQSVEEAYEQMTTKGELLGKLMDRVKNAGRHFSGAPAPSGGGQPQRKPPQASQEAPSWAPPKPYDDAVYKTGVSKAGKTWHAWMPPTKEDSREPKFFYQN